MGYGTGKNITIGNYVSNCLVKHVNCITACGSSIAIYEFNSVWLCLEPEIRYTYMELCLYIYRYLALYPIDLLKAFKIPIILSCKIRYLSLHLLVCRKRSKLLHTKEY